MKIAVVHNLPPGGQKRALYEQVKRLGSIHHLDLFTLSSTDESFLDIKPFVKEKITTWYIHPPRFPASLFSIYFVLPYAYKQLAERINSQKYDVVYVNPCWLTQAPYILRHLQAPSLYFCPEPKREFYERIPRRTNCWSYTFTFPFRLPLKVIDALNTRAATRVITNSRYSKKQIDRVYRVSSYVNYLGVDTDKFRLFEKSRENIALTIGGFSLLKGHDFIIESLSQIPVNTRPKLIIIGQEGKEEKYLKSLAQKKNVKLELYKNISDEELIVLYNKALLFVFAARNEPFGMALLEALSCGLSVVAVRGGGIEEIIDSQDLGIITEKDKIKFAIAVESVMKKTSDKDRKKRRQLIKKKWNWGRSVKELEKHLRETANL